MQTIQDFVAPILYELDDFFGTSQGEQYLASPQGRREIYTMGCTWVPVKVPLWHGVRLISSFIGTYRHPSERVSKTVNQLLRSQPGGWTSLIEAIASQTCLFGYCYAQRVAIDGEYKGVFTLDPRHIELKGSRTGIQTLTYLDEDIPLSSVLKITSSGFNNASPWGLGSGHSTIAIYHAYKLVSNLMLVAARVNATSLLVGKGDFSKPLTLEKDGGQIRTTAGEQLKMALQKITSSGYAVTDAANEVEALDIQADEGFFVNTLRYLNELAVVSTGWPSTMVLPTGTGDSNLAKYQMRAIVADKRSQADVIAEGLLEELIAPLLQFTYGRIPGNDLGVFVPARRLPLGTLQWLVEQGAIDPETEDLEMLMQPEF
jgi:hypothetical protein